MSALRHELSAISRLRKKALLFDRLVLGLGFLLPHNFLIEINEFVVSRHSCAVKNERIQENKSPKDYSRDSEQLEQDL